MVFQVLEQKYVSYEKLIAKLAKLFPNDATVRVEVRSLSSPPLNLAVKERH
jgi:hypothetical protein